VENTKPESFEFSPPSVGRSYQFLSISALSTLLVPGGLGTDPGWEQQEAAEPRRLLRRGPGPAGLGLSLVPVTTAAGICASIRVILEIM